MLLGFIHSSNQNLNVFFFNCCLKTRGTHSSLISPQLDLSFSDRAVLKKPIQFIGSFFSVITSIHSMTEKGAVELFFFLQQKKVASVLSGHQCKESKVFVVASRCPC